MINAPEFGVSDDLLRSYGLRRGASHLVTYCCPSPDAVEIPIDRLSGRKIAAAGQTVDPQRLERIVKSLSRGELIDAIPVYREPAAKQPLVLLDGAHRLAILAALGFRSVWCRYVSREDAQTLYGFAEGEG